MRKHKSIQVFQNPFLERLTHVHPIVPLLFWTPMIIFLMWRSFSPHSHGHELGVGKIGMLAFSGFFIWTLTEYLLHRFIFHFEPANALQERIAFLIHGLHHADPVDPTRLVMPPAAGVILATLLYLFFRAILGTVHVDPFFAAFLVGYLCYDYIHYWIHHYTPRSRIGKLIKHNHMIHHHVSMGCRWGVSSPFWDYVFGTIEEPKRIRHGT